MDEKSPKWRILAHPRLRVEVGTEIFQVDVMGSKRTVTDSPFSPRRKKSMIDMDDLIWDLNFRY